jgi:hypothetical protein
MKQPIFAIAAMLFLFSSCCREESMSELTDRVFSVAQEQSLLMAARLGELDTPRTFEDGQCVNAPAEWWCSGFFPGSLWYIYEYTGDDRFAQIARKETAKVEPVKFINDHHDVGFQINCSFGHQYRLTGDTTALAVMRTAAHSLAYSFSPVVGCIKSWPFVKEGFEWVYPVIIDNMMNLELLMVMGNMDDDQKLRNVAVSHADKTMENHFREDFTTFHLVDYVPETGAVNKRITVQGLADASAWARGQAWALYGYVMMFQQTADRKYLTLAQNIADMIITYLPEDGIPYWDFNDPKIPDTNRDASAGAIMASAFIVLDQVADNGKDYMSVAERQLRTLAGPEYLAEVGTNGNFLLKHSVGCLPENVEVDVPLTYADYYFLEALLRYRNANNK